MGRLVDDHNKEIYCDALEDEHEYVGKKLDLVEVVRCKDCKHKPIASGVNHEVITFPEEDYKCPCRCEDFWYSWMPDDNWFCGNGERKDEGRMIWLWCKYCSSWVRAINATVVRCPKCGADITGITKARIDEYVKIVRCKDCKYWRDNDCKNDNHGYCPINENDFCSRGERREK